MTLLYRGNRYQVLETLGEGGSGTVYRAKDLLEGREVALKVFAPEPAGVSSEKSSETSGISHLARSEFRLLASQSHPNIVRVLDYGLAEDDLCYFTMELLRGRDFLTFSRKEPGRIDEVLKQVLEALDYIHQRGLVHLDLKPSNILVTLEENGSLVTKLVDFGLTRVGGVGSVEVSGTVEYLSPERIRGEPADARSDLYSLGVTLFEVLTAECPFSGSSPGEVIRAHLERPPPLERLPEKYRAVVGRLLEKEPSRRPPSAWDVKEALFGAPDRCEQALPAFGAAFVVRDDALRRIESAIASAKKGSPRSLLLRGPTGMGKSRLLREVQVRLQLQGQQAGLESSRGAVQWPGELLRRLLRRAFLEGRKTAGAEELLAELDLLAEEGPPEAEGDPILLEARRERTLHQAVKQLLDLAEERATTLLVDDFHRADSLSREAILMLLRTLEHRGSSRLAIILASRDEEESDLEAVEEVERAAKGFGSFESFTLKGLREEDVEAYLFQVLGPEASSKELARSLQSQTGGNFFFLEEYLKLLIQSGQIRRSGAKWKAAAGGPLAVPATVGEAISRRLARLRGAEKETLEWAAVLDAPFTPDEMKRLLSRRGELDPRDVESALAELGLEQLLEREGLRYVFSSSAARDVVYGAMDEEERRQRHGVVAQGILQRPGAGGPGALEDIAHHLYHSENPASGREYLIRAGVRARRAGALREALLYFSRALEFLEGSADASLRFSILLSRESVLGLLGRKEAQKADIDRLKSLVEGMGGSPEELKRLAREAALREALYLESLGRKREALERLEATLASLTGDPGAEARLRARIAMLRLFLSDFEGGFRALEQALEQARQVGDGAVEAEILQLTGLGHYLRSNFDQALEDMGRALAMRREEGEEHRAASLESNLGLIHLDRGDLEAAEERFRASLKLFRRVGLRRGEAVNLLNLGLVYFEMGRYERALDSIQESLAIRRELGDRRGEGADQGNLAAVWIAIGCPERAVPPLEEALRLARELDNLQSESANECRFGQVESARGNPERALERFERGLEVARKAGAKSQQILAFQGMARAHLSMGQPQKAREEAERALALASSSQMQARAITSSALLSSALLSERRLEEADRVSREAVEKLERHPGWLADAHILWFERYRVLAAHTPGEAKCDEALRRAYLLLRERSAAFQDEELLQGYLENIPVHREINQLHESLQARTRREARLREHSFHEIAKSIHSILEIDPLLDRLLELLIETTHAEKGLITLKNPDESFTIRAAHGMARESVDDATDICRSVIADVAKGGEPVLAADAGSDDRFRERRSIISFRIRTLMCVPMKVRDEIMGAVYVDGRGASSFNRDDLEYLVSFSQLAAIAVENARLLERLRAENLYLRREVETRHRFESLVGSSPPMEKLASLIDKVANTMANVLIGGETGTGKELVARAIHYAGDRKSRPFVTIDCGALPENLLESELFGHAKGAFSGAIHDRIGLFEEAEGGTIFLDEITNTSLDLQAKLLRVLQESEVRRVGENLIRKVNVRVIVATNLDIHSLVERGKFREDLYYRLNVVLIEVPPLRERREDIPLLALHFLKKSAARHSKEIAGFTKEAMDFLVNAPWRGNVRELENLVEKAVILGEESRVSRPFLESLVPPSARPREKERETKGSLLPARSVAGEGSPSLSPFETEKPLTLEEFDKEWLEAEKSYLTKLVSETEGNLAEAARRAQVRNRNTLISRLKKHGLGKKDPSRLGLSGCDAGDEPE